MTELSYFPPSSGKEFKLTTEGHRCLVRTADDDFVELHYVINEFGLKLTVLKDHAPKGSLHLSVAMEYLLSHHPEILEIELNDEGRKTFSRSEFFQLPALWHHQKDYVITPEKWTKTNDRHHPIRPRPVQGVSYRRFIPQINGTVSLRLTHIEKDLDTFHEWHNQPRVSFFWELNQSKEELRDYMTKAHADPHQVPMIVEINGESVGYFEMYWVREDRLGPYYESDAFDRGFHFLIGNKKYLGHKTTDSIIKCVLHFLFLEDARTRRVMAEPRHDNQKVLKYAEASIGWRKVKIFDFPHKRAWLLENSREIFFGGNAL